MILYAKCMSAQSGNPDLSWTLSPLALPVPCWFQTDPLTDIRDTSLVSPPESETGRRDREYNYTYYSHTWSHLAEAALQYSWWLPHSCGSADSDVVAWKKKHNLLISQPKRMLWVLKRTVLFVWFDSLRPINNLSSEQERVFLGWTSTKLGWMCLAPGPQYSDSGEAQTRSPSVSSQALYHWNIIFLFLNQNVCCGYSKELFQWVPKIYVKTDE